MWSKLVHTHAGRVAKAAYDYNDLPYHNWQHILDCYKYLQKNQVPYSEALDGAVLFHDVVYKPGAEDNEEQSAKWFLERFPEVECKNVIADMIRGTKTHDLNQTFSVLGVMTDEFDWLCRADLHGFTRPVKTVENYGKIMAEYLGYGATDDKIYEFALANKEFMKKLQVTCKENNNFSAGYFWIAVSEGIQYYIDISKGISMEKD